MVEWECPTKPREASGLDPEAVHVIRFPESLVIIGYGNSRNSKEISLETWCL